MNLGIAITKDYEKQCVSKMTVMISECKQLYNKSYGMEREIEYI